MVAFSLPFVGLGSAVTGRVAVGSRLRVRRLWQPNALQGCPLMSLGCSRRTSPGQQVVRNPCAWVLLRGAVLVCRGERAVELSPPPLAIYPSSAAGSSARGTQVRPMARRSATLASATAWVAAEQQSVTTMTR